MKLHDQVLHLKKMVAEQEDQNNELRRYLNSSKFHIDKTVQVSDLFLRLDEGKRTMDALAEHL